MRVSENVSCSIHHHFVIRLFLWPEMSIIQKRNERSYKPMADSLVNGLHEVLTYVSDLKPQCQFLASLRDACFLARSTTCRVIAALIDDIFPRHVDLRRMLRHFHYFLVWPAT